MNKKKIKKVFVKALSGFLVFDANSASCIVMNQQKIPDKLKEFKFRKKDMNE